MSIYKAPFKQTFSKVPLMNRPVQTEMVDIQSAIADIRRKKKKREEEGNHGTKI